MDVHERCVVLDADQHYDWESTACGDLAYEYQSDSVVVPGTRHVTEEVKGEGVDVVDDYFLTVGYHW